MHITSWTNAKAQGLKQYFTGIPCKAGHVAARDVSDRSCYLCKLQKAAAWKHQNAEKHAAANRAWAERNNKNVRRTQLKVRAKDPRGYWASSTFQNARKRALRKGVPFSITRQDLLDALTDKCPVFGTVFDFIGAGRITPESPSLDRARPELGYVRDNIAIISMKANAIKQNATWEQVRAVADWMQNR